VLKEWSETCDGVRMGGGECVCRERCTGGGGWVILLRLKRKSALFSTKCSPCDPASTRGDGAMWGRQIVLVGEKTLVGGPGGCEPLLEGVRGVWAARMLCASLLCEDGVSDASSRGV